MAIEELIRRYEAGGGDLAKASAEGLAVPPALHTVVLTVHGLADGRLRVLGLEMGDVHVMRNAGGVTDDMIRSLAISQRKLGTREILLVHHTGCGLLKFTDDDFSELEAETGMRPSWAPSPSATRRRYAGPSRAATRRSSRTATRCAASSSTS